MMMMMQVVYGRGRKGKEGRGTIDENESDYGLMRYEVKGENN